MFWILNILPNFILFGVLWLGFVLYGVSYVLPPMPLKRILKKAGIWISAAGIFFAGYATSNTAWKDKAAELQHKAELVEQQAESASRELDAKAKVVFKTIREKGQTTIEYVDREVVKYNDQCNIPQEVVTAHNKAAQK